MPTILRPKGLGKIGRRWHKETPIPCESEFFWTLFTFQYQAVEFSSFMRCVMLADLLFSANVVVPIFLLIMLKREFWKDTFCDRNSLLYQYVGGGAFDAPPFAKFSFPQGKYYYPPFIFPSTKVFWGCGGLFSKSLPRILHVFSTYSPRIPRGLHAYGKRE